jgi:hypothetical protein
MARSSLRSKVGRLVAALGFVAALWACNAPFIPVPPPTATFTPALVADGVGGQKTVWITDGAVNHVAAMARFFIYDNDSGNGVIVRANPDGSYRAAPFDGVRGDHVFIYYEDTTGQNSEVGCQILHEGSDPERCAP